jgi:hypothetical protein
MKGMNNKMKRFAGFLVILLIAVLFLFGTTASAGLMVDKGMDTVVMLVPGNTVIVTVNFEDLNGTSFENFLFDLRYDPTILGKPRVISSSEPANWTLYKGVFGDGRITYFAADETAQNPTGKEFTMDIEFKVVGLAAVDTPFNITVDVSGTAIEDGKYVTRTSSKSQKMILQGGVPEGTVLTGDDGNKYIVTGNNEVAFYKPDADATSVTIPDTFVKSGFSFKVTKIRSKAFAKNTKVKTVTIGKNVKTIGEEAFSSATSLTTVKGNDGLITIKEKAFFGCKALKSFAFGKKLKTLEASAFEGCAKLSKVTLNNKVSFVGAKAFCGCSGLKTLEIKTRELDDISTVGKKAFDGTPRKMKVTISAGKSTFDEIRETLIERGVNRNAKFSRK